MFKNILILGSTLLFTGCATLTSSTVQSININSNPSGAKVYIDGEDRGTTPQKVDLKRKENHVVKIELAGYQPHEIKLTKKVNGWVWGNIIFGGLIGLAIDAGTGAMYKLSQEEINVQLVKGNASIINDEDGMYVTVVLAPDSQWKKWDNLNVNN